MYPAYNHWSPGSQPGPRLAKPCSQAQLRAFHGHWRHEANVHASQAFLAWNGELSWMLNLCQGLQMHSAKHLARCLILRCQISALHFRKMQTKGVSANLIELAWVVEVETQQMLLSKWELLFKTLTHERKAYCSSLTWTQSWNLFSQTLPFCLQYIVGLRHKLGLFPAPLLLGTEVGCGPSSTSPPTLYCTATKKAGDFEFTPAAQQMSHRFEHSNRLFG